MVKGQKMKLVRAVAFGFMLSSSADTAYKALVPKFSKSEVKLYHLFYRGTHIVVAVTSPLSNSMSGEQIGVVTTACSEGWSYKINPILERALGEINVIQSSRPLT